MGADGAFITGSGFLTEGGVTASYFYGEPAYPDRGASVVSTQPVQHASARGHGMPPRPTISWFARSDR